MINSNRKEMKETPNPKPSRKNTPSKSTNLMGNKVLKATDIVTVEITVTVPLDTSIAIFPVSGPYGNGLGTVIR